MARIKQATPAQRRRIATTRRDAALERLTAITAGIGVATIATVGAFGVYVAKALPGHHAAPPTSGTSTAGNSGNSGNSGTGSNGSNSLNPPSSAPQSASLPAPVTSGSS